MEKKGTCRVLTIEQWREMCFSSSAVIFFFFVNKLCNAFSLMFFCKHFLSEESHLFVIFILFVFFFTLLEAVSFCFVV